MYNYWQVGDSYFVRVGFSEFCGILLFLVFMAMPMSDLRAQSTGEVCGIAHSPFLGMAIVSRSIPSASVPSCSLMASYAKWLEDSVFLQNPYPLSPSLELREWDFAAGAVLLSSPSRYIAINGDSLRGDPGDESRTLFLSMRALQPSGSLIDVGAWSVVNDSRGWRANLSDVAVPTVFRDSRAVLFTVGEAELDSVLVVSQLNAAERLRSALGITSPIPFMRIVVGPPSDDSLGFLGISRTRQSVRAITISPPLTILARVVDRGLHPHELAHAVLRREAGRQSAAAEEALATYFGGLGGETFGRALCAMMLSESIPNLGMAELDSIRSGAWWADDRSAVSALVLATAVSWFIAYSGDSAILVAKQDQEQNPDLLLEFASRVGVSDSLAASKLILELERRRNLCVADQRRR